MRKEAGIRRSLIVTLIFFVLCVWTIFVSGSSMLPRAQAQTADELQKKIAQRNQDIANLEKEIVKYQKQIETLGTQATTLSTTIKSLDLTQKKLSTDIQVTENKIDAKNLEIQSLTGQIGDKEDNIYDDRRIITHTLVAIAQTGDPSLPEIFLGGKSIAGVLKEVDQLAELETGLHDRIALLNQDKSTLESSKQASEKAQSDLKILQRQLRDQRAVVLATAAEQKSILAETNQSEATFRRILAEKKAQEEAFQQEINAFESQLHLLVNPALLPHTGSGVLAWPLDNIFITQYFGNTPFATANPQLYNGKGHTGVDFRASIGTPVKAALNGTVVGVGNTDLVHGCYSYGQWIMIKHPNGLSTLYGHMSLESVSVGQVVTTGQVIGYSGNTGYTTGPHLHFGVYATQGVQIKKFDTSVSCKGAVIPIADYKAYLNPLSYL